MERRDFALKKLVKKRGYLDLTHVSTDWTYHHIRAMTNLLKSSTTRLRRLKVLLKNETQIYSG